MTILAELNKLKSAKTKIRKSIQRKGTGLTLSDLYGVYHKFIKNMSDERNPDETDLLNYAEDRCYYLELDVDHIRPYAFREYTCLQYLYLKPTKKVTLSNINAFYGTNTKILVPSNLLNTYKSDTVWSKLSDRIQAYSVKTQDNMYLLQHIDKAYSVGWLGSKKVKEIINEFRV